MNSKLPLSSHPTTKLEFYVYQVELPYRDIFSNILMGYNETNSITSTIGLTSSNTLCELPCYQQDTNLVKMVWPDWYEQFSTSITTESESRAEWKEVLSNCFKNLSQAGNLINITKCVHQLGYEKVTEVETTSTKIT